MKKIDSIEELGELILNYSSFTIVTHINPDGDTLGSAFALRELLWDLDKDADIVCADKTPDRLMFLTDGESIGYTEKSECVISVDVAEPKLTGGFDTLYEGIDIKIDHHTAGVDFAKYNYVSPQSSACGEIITELAIYYKNKYQKELSYNTAWFLYCAISSDTGCFRYSNTTAKTHTLAAFLMNYGIDTVYIDEMLHIQTSFKTLLTDAEVTKRMRFFADGKIGIAYADSALIKDINASWDDLGNIVDIPRRVDGVEIAASLKEKENNEYKISLRTRNVDCTKIAAVFGGGGHTRASGCSLTAENMDEAIEKLVKVCEKSLKEENIV